MPANSLSKKSVPSKKSSAEILPKQSGDKSSDLETLFISSIRELYWAENHLVMNLPKIQEAAGKASLKNAVGSHLTVTKGHVRRLEEIFGLLGQVPMAKKSDAMEGLALEGEGVINTTAAGSAARDTGLIMACQKVEHYEIAAYRGLSLLATQLGRDDISKLLSATLAEEEKADSDLGALAQKG